MGSLLVVDDDPLLRDCVKAMLVSQGYEVNDVKDGLGALMLFQKLRGEITLVIVDNNLPRMDGLAATSVIKAAEPNAKVLLCSGYHQSLPADVRADAFLPKPFHAKELVALVQQFLGEVNPAHERT